MAQANLNYKALAMVDHPRPCRRSQTGSLAERKPRRRDFSIEQ
jgi:hypothetical protein